MAPKCKPVSIKPSTQGLNTLETELVRIRMLFSQSWTTQEKPNKLLALTGGQVGFQALALDDFLLRSLNQHCLKSDYLWPLVWSF